MEARLHGETLARVFDIRDGKIAAWRGYFDLATWQRQTA
jgi:limonene-1,2-epoxide hydrolase